MWKRIKNTANLHLLYLHNKIHDYKFTFCYNLEGIKIDIKVQGMKIFFK